MDIEALARKAGMRTELAAGAASCVWTRGVHGVSAMQLEVFARLVAEAEREACARVCRELEATGTEPTGEVCAMAIEARSNVV